MLVEATNASSKFKIQIKELNRIVEEGERFEVTHDRFLVLSGANGYRTVFVKKCEPEVDTKNECVKENVQEDVKQKPKRTRKKKVDVIREDSKE